MSHRTQTQVSADEDRRIDTSLTVQKFKAQLQRMRFTVNGETSNLYVIASGQWVIMDALEAMYKLIARNTQIIEQLAVKNKIPLE